MPLPKPLIFNPDPELAMAILSAFSDPKMTFRDLADQADTSVEALSFWVEQDEIQDRLNAMQNSVIQRNRMMAAEYIPSATRVLALVIAETEYLIKKIPLDENNLHARETHRRIYETGRRASAMIYKLANQPYVTTRRPKLFKDHPSDTPRPSSKTSASFDASVPTDPSILSEAAAAARAEADAQHAFAVEFAQNLLAKDGALQAVEAAGSPATSAAPVAPTTAAAPASAAVNASPVVATTTSSALDANETSIATAAISSNPAINASSAASAKPTANTNAVLNASPEINASKAIDKSPANNATTAAQVTPAIQSEASTASEAPPTPQPPQPTQKAPPDPKLKRPKPAAALTNAANEHPLPVNSS